MAHGKGTLCIHLPKCFHLQPATARLWRLVLRQSLSHTFQTIINPKLSAPTMLNAVILSRSQDWGPPAPPPRQQPLPLDSKMSRSPRYVAVQQVTMRSEWPMDDRSDARK